MPSGGYRQPSKPAAVSGPGALSQRTDKGQPVRDITGGDYGEASEFRNLQQSAPLATGPSPSGGGGAPQATGPQVTPFGAPTEMPGTPVTAGAAQGAGPGTGALGMPSTFNQTQKQDAQELAPYLGAMIAAAQRPDATTSFKRYVRTIIANL